MKDKLMVTLFIGVLIVFGVGNLILEDVDTSKYERRKLMTIEELKEDFIDNLDEYLTDQLPFRNELISLNSVYERYVLANDGANDVYIKNGYIFEKDEVKDDKGIDGFIKKVSKIENTNLKQSRVFYTIIPDKSHFLEGLYLKMDYEHLRAKVVKELPGEEVSIEGLISLEDYYKTDIHLKQEAYFDYVKKFMKRTGREANVQYTKKFYRPFYGASYSKGPSFMETDTIEYFTNDMLDRVSVKHLEFGEKKVYDEEKLLGVDSYDVFLSGPSSSIEIVNDEVEDGHLIVFRDSFASSLVPLMIPYYNKITLVDLRYINMSIVERNVDFDGADVLFIYGAQSVDRSHLLKANS